MTSPILKQLGLTPEVIRRHVIKIEAPLPKWESKAKANWRLQGLTQHGKQRKGKA